MTQLSSEVRCLKVFNFIFLKISGETERRKDADQEIADNRAAHCWGKSHSSSFVHTFAEGFRFVVKVFRSTIMYARVLSMIAFLDVESSISQRVFLL